MITFSYAYAEFIDSSPEVISSDSSHSQLASAGFYMEEVSQTKLVGDEQMDTSLGVNKTVMFPSAPTCKRTSIGQLVLSQPGYW